MPLFTNDQKTHTNTLLQMWRAEHPEIDRDVDGLTDDGASSPGA